jgi:hypothetical protein
MTQTTINCREACINGCILGDKCPNLEHLASVRKFMAETSIEKMLEIAANRFAPKEDHPPKPSA